MTLFALPDICAALESNNGESKKNDYCKWFNDNLAQKMSFITAENFYKFRSGLVHQAIISGIDKYDYSRIIFPIMRNNSFDNCASGNTYIYSLDTFSSTIFSAIASWYELNKNNSIVQKNIKKLLKVHPDGLSPDFVGMPVIA